MPAEPAEEVCKAVLAWITSASSPPRIWAGDEEWAMLEALADWLRADVSEPHPAHDCGRHHPIQVDMANGTKSPICCACSWDNQDYTWPCQGGGRDTMTSDIDTAAIRAALATGGPLVEAATVQDIPVAATLRALCDALDAARADAEGWEHAASDLGFGEYAGLRRRCSDLEAELAAATAEAQDRAEEAEARLAAITAERDADQDLAEDWEMDCREVEKQRDKALARLAAVESELARREECAAAERAVGRRCDYCEDFIPEIRDALGGP